MLVLSVELQGRDKVVIRPDGRLKVNYISCLKAYYVFYLFDFCGADDKAVVEQDVAIAFLVANALSLEVCPVCGAAR